MILCQCKQTGVHLVLQAVVCQGQAGAMLRGCRRQMRAAVAAWSTLECQHPAASVHLGPQLPMPAPHTFPKTGWELHLFCTVHCSCSAGLLDDRMTAHGCHGMTAEMKLDAELHFASTIDTTHLLKLSPTQLHCKKTSCRIRLFRQHRGMNRLCLAVLHLHFGSEIQRCAVHGSLVSCNPTSPNLAAMKGVYCHVQTVLE